MRRTKGLVPGPQVEKDIFFERREIVSDTNANANITKTIIYYNFRTSLPNGDKSIKEFMEKAYGWYQDEIRKQQDDSRYYYSLLSSAAGGSDEDGGAKAPVHRQYKVSGGLFSAVIKSCLL
jgi:hypothetical protein